MQPYTISCQTSTVTLIPEGLKVNLLPIDSEITLHFPRKP